MNLLHLQLKAMIEILFNVAIQRHPVLSKVDDFATFKKVEVHAENSTFYKVEVV